MNEKREIPFPESLHYKLVSEYAVHDLGRPETLGRFAPTRVVRAH